MKPGPELNLKVALEIMGWEQHPDYKHLARDTRPQSLGAFMDIKTSLPKYSEDIAAAWEVVEKLKSNSQNHMIDIFWDVDLWYCHIHSHDKIERHVYGEETAPHAICRAALKSVGVEVE